MTRSSLPNVLAPLALGFILIYIGLSVRAFDVGSCPTMGFNGVVASCVHTFPGTDIPIATAGEMIIAVGSVLIAATVITILYPRMAKSGRAEPGNEPGVKEAPSSNSKNLITP